MIQEMAEEGALEFFRGLAEEFNVRDARKLYQIARRDHPERRDLTAARARAALRTDVAQQVLAQKPRSLGKSAADSPNDRLQADLIDFNVNTRGAKKYGLIVSDVFTREAVTKALPDKRAETVSAAAREIIPELVEAETNYNEFNGLEGALPEQVVHRMKDPSDRNATAVVDRTIQTLKRDLAGKVARWGRMDRPRGAGDRGLTPGRTRPCTQPLKMWKNNQPRRSECIRIMHRSSNITTP